SNSTIFFCLSFSGKTTLALYHNKSLVANVSIAWTEMRGVYILESGLTIKSASFKNDDPRIKQELAGDLLIENPNFDDSH
ncbi:phosphoenolpyruvate carboxykinase (ATP), partial [Francisella tularensis subsp. holarctica]|uniref:phosphoenolpyruvate carboxykinase (ATP) n=1 Tax=Francisella tularensis TaxID=263 RepID=UPI002381A865